MFINISCFRSLRYSALLALLANHNFKNYTSVSNIVVRRYTFEIERYNSPCWFVLFICALAAVLPPMLLTTTIETRLSVDSMRFEVRYRERSDKFEKSGCILVVCNLNSTLICEDLAVHFF